MSYQQSASPDIIVTIVTLLVGGMMAILIPIVIVFRVGGPKIAFWRALGVRFRGFRVYDLDGRAYTKFFKETDIKIHSPPYVIFKGLIRYVDATNCSRQFGAPVNHYHIDNSLPLPLMRGYRDNVLDPFSITKAYNTDILRRLLKLTEEKKPPSPSRLPTILIIVAVITAVLSAVYIVPRLFH